MSYALLHEGERPGAVYPVTASTHRAVGGSLSAQEARALSRPGEERTTCRLDGVRVLVVDDNASNQDVARELLEDEGAVVCLAGHGQEAVDILAAARPPFDLVLMDLRMPVMDGIAATHHVRNELGLVALPIIAMSASGHRTDRDACLAAGMNDLVGKPFDPDDLIGVLRRHMGLTCATETHSVPGDPALGAAIVEAATAAEVDLVGTLRRLGGKPEVYRRHLGTFIEDLRTLPARLRADAGVGAMPTAHLLHTLKGVAATLGAATLSTAAGEAERRQTGAPPLEAASAIEGVCATIGRAVPRLEALWRVLPDEVVPTVAPVSIGDFPAARSALGTLVGYLRSSDLAALEAIRKMRTDFAGALGARGAPLYDAIQALEFERALRLCDELSKDLEG